MRRDRRSHQSRCRSPGGRGRAAEGHAAHRAPVFLWNGAAYQRIGLRNYVSRRAGCASASRSTLISRTCSRCAQRKAPRAAPAPPGIGPACVTAALHRPRSDRRQTACISNRCRSARRRTGADRTRAGAAEKELALRARPAGPHDVAEPCAQLLPRAARRARGLRATSARRAVDRQPRTRSSTRCCAARSPTSTC